MTQTQKKIFEWPLIILILWLSQSLEIAVLSHLPKWMGAVQLAPIIIFYIASVRGWGILTVCTVIFALIGSSTSSYPVSIYISASLWTALTIKLFVTGITVEGRRSFFLLSFGGQILAKILTWGFLHSFSRSLPVLPSISIVIFNSILTAGVAWIVYPYLRGWDRYFEHNPEESGELSNTFSK